MFEEVVGRAGESAYEDRVVLRRYEGDGSEAQVHLPGHFLSVRLRATEAFTFVFFPFSVDLIHSFILTHDATACLLTRTQKNKNKKGAL